MVIKYRFKRTLMVVVLIISSVAVLTFLGYFIFQNEMARRTSLKEAEFTGDINIEKSDSDLQFAEKLPEYKILFTGLVQEDFEISFDDIIKNYGSYIEEIVVNGIRTDEEEISVTYTGIKLGRLLESIIILEKSKKVIAYATDLYAADFTMEEAAEEIYLVWRRDGQFLDPQKDGVIKIVQDGGLTKKWIKNPVLFDFIIELDDNDQVTGKLDERIISFFAQHRFFTLSIGEEPEVEIDSWELKIDGLVNYPLIFDYDDIINMPRKSVYTTLETISNPRSGLGFLKGDAVWTGVPFKYILDMAGIKDNALEVVFYCLDGYSTSIILEEAYRENVILSYRMNGRPLFKEHGYPVRMVVPGKYGMKWAKWLNRIEIVDYDYKGFWEQRGWSDDATREEYQQIYD